MKRLISNFQNAVHPGEYLCIDDSLLAFKGKLSFKQFNPMKRARFGIKTFVLADCMTNFVLDLLPYQGKSTLLENRTLITELGFGGVVVLTLLKNVLNKFHRVVVDNWFNGPNLAIHLLRAGTYVLGTVQKRRKYMPKTENMTRRLAKGNITTASTGSILVER